MGARERPLEATDERLQATESTGLDAVAHTRTIDFSANQTGLLEDFEVLGHGRLRQG
jgi:hypothetical protein